MWSFQNRSTSKKCFGPVSDENCQAIPDCCRLHTYLQTGSPGKCWLKMRWWWSRSGSEFPVPGLLPQPANIANNCFCENLLSSLRGYSLNWLFIGLTIWRVGLSDGWPFRGLFFLWVDHLEGWTFWGMTFIGLTFRTVDLSDRWLFRELPFRLLTFFEGCPFEGWIFQMVDLSEGWPFGGLTFLRIDLSEGWTCWTYLPDNSSSGG